MGSTSIAATPMYRVRRTHFQLILKPAERGCGGPLGGPLGGPPRGGPPPGGGPNGGCFGGGLPSRTALTTSTWLRNRGSPTGGTGGSTIVRRSSGAPGGRGGSRGGGAECAPASVPSLTPSATGPFRTSSADLLWRPSLFTGRTRAGSRRPCAACLWRTRRAEHV